MKGESLGVAPGVGSEPAAGSAPAATANNGGGDGGGKPAEGTKPATDSTPKGTKEGTAGGAKGGKPAEEKEELIPASRFNGLMSNYNQEQARIGALIKATGSKTYEEALIKVAQMGQKAGEKTEPTEELPAYLKPGWKPETIEEIQEALRDATSRGTSKAIEIIEGKARTQAETVALVDQIVAGFKEADPEFDEDSFYAFARTHDFPLNTPNDLKAVNSAYKEVREARKAGQAEARKNIDERKAEPVNKPGGASAPASGGTPWNEIRKAGSVHDAAMKALKAKQ